MVVVRSPGDERGGCRSRSGLAGAVGARHVWMDEAFALELEEKKYERDEEEMVV